MFGPQGETRAVVNSAGTITQSYAYTAYGETVASGNSTESTRFRYGGQWGYYTQDGMAGLMLCGLRWYDPRQGRWLSRDPIGYEGGPNLYEYCTSDPTNGVDPQGLTKVKGNFYIFAVDRGGSIIEKLGIWIGSNKDIAKQKIRFYRDYDVTVIEEPSKDRVIEILKDPRTKGVVFIGHCAKENGGGISLREHYQGDDQDFIEENEIEAALKSRTVLLDYFIAHVCFSDNAAMRKAIDRKVKRFEGSKGAWQPVAGDQGNISWRSKKGKHGWRSWLP